MVPGTPFLCWVCSKAQATDSLQRPERNFCDVQVLPGSREAGQNPRKRETYRLCSAVVTASRCQFLKSVNGVTEGNEYFSRPRGTQGNLLAIGVRVIQHDLPFLLVCPGGGGGLCGCRAVCLDPDSTLHVVTRPPFHVLKPPGWSWTWWRDGAWPLP